MNELLIRFVENDPLYESGYTDIRLADSEVSIGGISKHLGGVFPRRYYYSLRLNFRYSGDARFIGADCDTLETAKDKACRQLAIIFSIPKAQVKEHE